MMLYLIFVRVKFGALRPQKRIQNIHSSMVASANAKFFGITQTSLRSVLSPAADQIARA